MRCANLMLAACTLLALDSLDSSLRAQPTDRHGDPLPTGAVARLGTRAFHHADGIHAVAFAPNNKLLAVLAGKAADGDTLTLWEIETRRIVQHIKFKSAGVACNELRFSPDGTLLALLAARGDHPQHRYEGAVQIWDWAAGKEIKPFGNAVLRNVAFSPDRCTAAFTLAGDVESIVLWNLKKKQPVHRVRIKNDAVNALAFSGDGKTLHALSHNSRIHAWDTATVREFPPAASPARTSVRISDDGAWIVSRDSTTGNWAVRDATTDRSQLDLGALTEPFSFGQDNQTLLLAKRGAVQLLSIASGKETVRVPIPEHFQPKTMLSPDGKLLAVASMYQVRLYDLTRRPEQRARGWNDAGIDALTFSPDGKMLAATNRERYLLLWNVPDAAPVREPRLVHYPHQLRFSPDSTELWYTSNGVIHAEDCRTHKLVDRKGSLPKTPGAIFDGIFATRVSRFAMQAPVKGGPIIEKAKQQLAANEANPFGVGPHQGYFRLTTPGGRFFLLARAVRGPDIMNSEPPLQPGAPWTIFDAGTGVKRGVLADSSLDLAVAKFARFGFGAWPNPLAYSPDDQLVAWRGGNGKIHLTDLEQGRIRASVAAPSGDVVLFSRDGKTLVIAGGQDKRVLLCETATGAVRQAFAGHDAVAGCVAFSHDGSLLASGSLDATILLWDAFGLHATGNSRLSEPDLADAWNALAGADGQKAHAAAARLSRQRAQAIPWLQARLADSARDPRDIQRLIKALDSDRFTLRQEAEIKLRQLGGIAGPALRQALREPKALEARRRLETLLSDANGVPTGAWLQAYRGLELLERWHGVDALHALSRGDDSNPVTAEARRCWERAKAPR